MKTSALRRWLREERAEENLDALVDGMPPSWRPILDRWTVLDPLLRDIVVVSPDPTN